MPIKRLGAHFLNNNLFPETVTLDTAAGLTFADPMGIGFAIRKCFFLIWSLLAIKQTAVDLIAKPSLRIR